MKLTATLCNERTSTSLTNEALGLAIHIGCTSRPLRQSLFCKAHQIRPDGLPPEIRDHKRISGSVAFRYRGSDDFLPLQEMSPARLKQYDSRLALLDYAAADPQRFASATSAAASEARCLSD